MALATLEAPARLEQTPSVDADDEAYLALEALGALPAIEPGERLSAKAETYGRSSSSAHVLGALAIGKTMAEVVGSPEAAQAKIEFITSVREGLGTDEEFGGCLEVRDYDSRPVINGRVMSKDLERSISDMTDAGLVCAEETAKKDKRFLPQLARSVWDHENALQVDRMARGETDYNTIMVVSPFPLEAATESGDAFWRMIGYVPSLKRGFVQLYHVTEAGEEILTGSLSFDGTDKQRLRDAFERRGIKIPPGEITDNWLKYAITGTLSTDEAIAFATELADEAGDPSLEKSTNTVDVTKHYEAIMERAFNESYPLICESLARGRQTPETKNLIHQFANNAHNFNERYAKALYKMRASEQFTHADWAVMHELLVYSTIEMMRALHLKETAFQKGSSPEGYEGVDFSLTALQLADSSSFQNMLGDFGADGAKNNRTYSACGISISLGEEKLDGKPQSPFGGQDGESESSTENGACDYVHTGCYCCPYNDDGSSRGSPLKVVARRESNGTAYCKRAGCGAWLSADGKKGDIGNIARRAQMMRRSQKAASYALAA